MKRISGKLYPRSVKGKILAAFLLAFAAFLLAFSISKLAFTDMLGKVEELSEPSGKLTLLNKVFQEVTTLDQMQRAQALRNPRMPHSAFLNQSQRTLNLIDSISLQEWDSLQLKRISAMKDVLHRRDSLFFSYLKLKSNLIDNRTLTRRIDTLSSILEKKKIEVDSNIVTTEKRTTTTYVKDTVRPVVDDRSFFGKIFGKKKKPEPESEPLQLQVEEEFRVIVDTLLVANQNKALEEIEKIMFALEKDQRTESKQLLERELQLINTNSLLVNQLLGILREVEKEEFEKMQARSTEAGVVVSESVRRISLLLVAFFLGAALLVYLIWIDISKSNFYKEQLERSRDEAQELSQIKQRFLANMSHEIRTPLQSIIGFAEHLKHEKKPDPEAIDAIHSSSEHLLHIVNEVLDYSRISSGNFMLAKEKFRLMEVIREVEAAIRIQAGKKDLSLILDFEQASDFALAGDSFRLRQILYNLLGNAIKFTTRGFVRLSVKTSPTSDNRIACQFEITDTGIGIRSEDINKIFNQFEQADTSITRTFGGTGLGLTIVKSLVEAQGGNLTLQSELGSGSTFTVFLTFDRSQSDQDVLRKELTIVHSPETGPGTVLVVDDDPMILRLCGLMLSKNNITHVLFNDPEELLNRNPDKNVTHVLMDIRMPKINGVDLCQAMLTKYPASTRFVALTAHVFPQEKKFLEEKGFHFVLSKPFHEEELLNMFGISQKPSVVASEPANEIDLEPLRKITLYDENLLQAVIEQFREETSGELAQLETAIADRDRVTIRNIVHKLAGRVGQVGVLTLSLKLRDTETKIEKGEDFDAILPDILAQRAEVKGLVAQLSEYLVAKP